MILSPSENEIWYTLAVLLIISFVSGWPWGGKGA